MVASAREVGVEGGAGVGKYRSRGLAEPIVGGDDEVRAYRINGAKEFITNGRVAQFYTVLAKTSGGPSFFVIERDTPGFSVGEADHKHGIRASNTTSIVLEDVEVPADQLLGLEEGRGLEQANAVFGFTRLMVAAFGLGAGEEAVHRSIRYGLERAQFGELALMNEVATALEGEVLRAGERFSGRGVVAGGFSMCVGRSLREDPWHATLSMRASAMWEPGSSFRALFSASVRAVRRLQKRRRRADTPASRRGWRSRRAWRAPRRPRAAPAAGTRRSGSCGRRGRARSPAAGAGS